MSAVRGPLCLEPCPFHRAHLQLTYVYRTTSTRLVLVLVADNDSVFHSLRLRPIRSFRRVNLEQTFKYPHSVCL
jgi:hypothetical protein